MFRLLLSILTVTNFAHAGVCPSEKNQNVKVIKALYEAVQPTCIQREAKHFKNTKVSEVISRLTEDISNDELFIRLIFAESLASNCNLNDDQIFESIAWTLKNRVDRKSTYGNGTDRGVVLKPNQFNSSTGNCDVAKRTEFLCPTSFKGWERAWINATKAWEKTKSLENPMPSVRHYFFPTHFDNSKTCKRWKGIQPDWSTNENTVSKIGNCATFHNVDE